MAAEVRQKTKIDAVNLYGKPSPYLTLKIK
jgi:hypothetical protein